MPTLLDTERAVARAVLCNDCDAAVDLIARGRIEPEEALAIYRNTFISTCVRALRLAYPAVERLTGAEFFESAAAEFISANPPNGGCLDDYGRTFADFLAAFPPVATLPYLADVAKLEWAVNNALRADDVPAPDSEQFTAAAKIDPARLILNPHPSLALLELQFPADTIWRAVLHEDEAALAAITLELSPRFLAITRDEDVVVERLPQSAWHFLTLLCSGKTFAESFDAAPAQEISSLLAQYFTRGRFIGFEETHS